MFGSFETILRAIGLHWNVIEAALRAIEAGVSPASLMQVIKATMTDAARIEMRAELGLPEAASAAPDLAPELEAARTELEQANTALKEMFDSWHTAATRVTELEGLLADALSKVPAMALPTAPTDPAPPLPAEPAPVDPTPAG